MNSHGVQIKTICTCSGEIRETTIGRYVESIPYKIFERSRIEEFLPYSGRQTVYLDRKPNFKNQIHKLVLPEFPLRVLEFATVIVSRDRDRDSLVETVMEASDRMFRDSFMSARYFIETDHSIILLAEPADVFSIYVSFHNSERVEYVGTKLAVTRPGGLMIIRKPLLPDRTYIGTFNIEELYEMAK